MHKKNVFIDCKRIAENLVSHDCCANQLTGFYIRATLPFNGLRYKTKNYLKEVVYFDDIISLFLF